MQPTVPLSDIDPVEAIQLVFHELKHHEETGRKNFVVRVPVNLVGYLFSGILQKSGMSADSTRIWTPIPRTLGQRFHEHLDSDFSLIRPTLRQAATQDYSLPSASFIEAKRSSWSVYPCVKSERYYA